MSFTVLDRTFLQCIDPWPGKIMLLDRSLRKPFSSNAVLPARRSSSFCINLESLKTLVQSPFSGEWIFAGLQPGLSIE